MSFLAEHAIEEFLTLYGQEELERARALIGSSTLRAAATLIVEAQLGVARIFVPHYWAVYYHDGRGGFSAPAGRFLVFFADPADDPRIEGGRPVLESDVRHLTRDEFQAGLAENEIRALDEREPFMFVVRSVGPSGPHPFFDELAVGAATRADFLAELAIDQHVQDSIDEEGPQRSTVSARL